MRPWRRWSKGTGSAMLNTAQRYTRSLRGGIDSCVPWLRRSLTLSLPASEIGRCAGPMPKAAATEQPRPSVEDGCSFVVLFLRWCSVLFHSGPPLVEAITVDTTEATTRVHMRQVHTGLARIDLTVALTSVLRDRRTGASRRATTTTARVRRFALTRVFRTLEASCTLMVIVGIMARTCMPSVSVSPETI